MFDSVHKNLVDMRNDVVVVPAADEWKGTAADGVFGPAGFLFRY